MTDPPSYDDVPVRDADRLIQEQIAQHRGQMRQLRLRRGQRLQRELDAGRTATEVAAEIGTSAQVVYELTREARLNQPAPEEWWEGLDEADRKRFAEYARRPTELPRELADKMRAAGILVSEWGFDGLSPVMPRAYADYVKRKTGPAKKVTRKAAT